MAYAFSIEDGAANYEELKALYKAHFDETQDRLVSCGLRRAIYAPNLDQYRDAWDGGWLLNYVARHDGEAVGAANIYLTNDMHTGALIAVEDTLFVRKDHRNGLGRKLVRFIMDDLEARGVERVLIDAVTDLRVAKIWRRMGFTDYSQRMVYHFKQECR